MDNIYPGTCRGDSFDGGMCLDPIEMKSCSVSLVLGFG
jgi:hypothetical protein